MKCLWLWAVATAAAAGVTTTAFEITDKSEATVTIPQGSSGDLFCTSDVPYDFCKWSHVDQGKDCLISKDAIDEATTCKDDENIEWVVDSQRCGIRVNSASRAADAGDYKCILGVFGAEESMMSSEKFRLDVTVPSSIQFAQVSEDESPAADFTSDQTVAVEANTDVEFACQASGGHPEPHIRAVFGVHPDVVDESGFDFELAYDSERDQREEHEDGTVSLTRIFTLNAKPHDCGKYVKCSVVQVDDATGEQVEFPEGAATVLISRKVMVEFAPEPLHDGPLKPVMFVENDNVVTVRVVFEANPPPDNNQVIWHINPSGGDAADDSIVLEADETVGSEEVGIKYESPGLNVSGHHVTAVLRVFDPYPEMTDWSYYLDVRTEKGERQYGFNLIYVKDMIPEGYDDPSVGHEGEEPHVDGLGAGVIAVIVLIVVSAVLVVLVLCVAKKNNLCCFKYKGVPTKDTGVPCERHGPTPIIKNGGQGEKGSNEPQEKAKADPPVQDSPV